ncbi:hypothetical protein [Actinoplanes flavus]|uniref:Uncharacterized protein n=1 Tax=Actinoplanes flavus TaxID=2820290 RepID=A0ABS3UZ25_9ACTN|nr:hypothetical protein [Actinoplanes flavus]MBO3743827.1 hypothetical protein [Actinoplanes flavus]
MDGDVDAVKRTGQRAGLMEVPVEDLGHVGTLETAVARPRHMRAVGRLVRMRLVEPESVGDEGAHPRARCSTLSIMERNLSRYVRRRRTR